MKKNEIRKGGRYRAKVSGRLVTVKVDAIRRVGGSAYSRDKTVYDVVNEETGRSTTFKSAARFRQEVISTGKDVFNEGLLP